MWDALDVNKDGVLDYGEFIRGFFGEMNEERKNWVRKAFSRLDTSNSGVGNADNLYKFFCASKHPTVMSGKLIGLGMIRELKRRCIKNKYIKNILCNGNTKFAQSQKAYLLGTIIYGLYVLK